MRSQPDAQRISVEMRAEDHSPWDLEPSVAVVQPHDTRPSPVAPPPAATSFWHECKGKVDVVFLLSLLSVAAWALAGNAARLALHSAFLSIPFFSTYEFFGPNCIGSFAMGLFAFGLPPEKALPIVHRALGVGFCGSFTTFSSWVVDIANRGSAGGAFAELISGLTTPFIFFLRGKDTAPAADRLLHWRQSSSEEDNREEEENGNEETEEHRKVSDETKARTLLRAQYVFLAVSCAAAVAIPIAVQVRINQGRIHTVSSPDIKAAALGPAGAAVRFLLSVFLNKRPQWRGFPVGTLAANVLGVFLVVFMDNYAHQRPQNLWFWVVANGVCGALSTVSSFVNEVVGFYSAGRTRMAYIYALASLALTITIGAIGRRANFD